ncbi:MAG: VOC family protein [Bryobacteraceae bacterium]
MNIVTYLTFNGNCREAMTFYKECLGANLHLITFGEMNPAMPAETKDRIMHASLSLAKGVSSLMASDNMPGMPFTQGNNFSVSVLPESVEEIEKLWAAFSQGATIQHKLDDAPWGARYGMLTDKFGIQWMFNFEYPKK